jgi:hypothetical protein
MIQLHEPAPALVVGLPDPARVRVLEGTAELLLGGLRLHAKRVRALAATFYRETRRLPEGVGDGLAPIAASLTTVAAGMSGALTAVDMAVAVTFAGLDALPGIAVNDDLEQPEAVPVRRVAARAESLLIGLRERHDDAHMALREVTQGLVMAANNLAIVAGRPAAGVPDELRVIIRQLRALSAVTVTMTARLDVFVQNVGAVLRAALGDQPRAKATRTRVEQPSAVTDTSILHNDEDDNDEGEVGVGPMLALPPATNRLVVGVATVEPTHEGAY